MTDHADDGVEPEQTYAPDHEPDEPDEHDEGYDPYYLGGSRKAKKKRGFSGCLAVIVALAVVVGGAFFVGTKGFHYLKDHLSHSADYDGPGHGKVTFEVKQGDSTTVIGQHLKADGVVASVDAFVSAANGDKGIQVGFYQLKKEMSAADAYKVLKNPDNLIQTTVTIPEGLRVVDIVGILADKTKYSVAQFDAALKNTDALGLPAYAKGNPEGYLFPSTYPFGPTEKPIDMLTDMVDRWKQAATDDDLVSGAATVRQDAGRDHDDRQPDPGRGSRQRHAEDLARDLQPARRAGEQGGHERAAADRRDRQLRPPPHRRGRGDDGRDDEHRLAVQHVQVPRAATRPRSTRRETRPSRPP